MQKGKKSRVLVLGLYFVFILMPIYWLVNMSLKPNTEILGELSLFPGTFTLEHYRTIFADPAWYMGYVHALQYVLLNTATLCV